MHEERTFSQNEAPEIKNWSFYFYKMFITEVKSIEHFNTILVINSINTPIKPL